MATKPSGKSFSLWSWLYNKNVKANALYEMGREMRETSVEDTLL